MASDTHSFVSSASLLVGLQLGSRLFTFGLNQALLRFVSPRAFGTAAIQFELLSSTILFLSREGFRNALIRAWNNDRKDGKLIGVPIGIANLTLVPTLIGVPVSILTSLTYRVTCSTGTTSQPYFDAAVATYAIASCLELASEPLHIRTMGELNTALRVKAEGAGIIAKTLTTFLIILLGERGIASNGTYALIAFAIGQFAYASMVVLVYFKYYGFRTLRLQRQPGHIMSSFDKHYLRLSLSMTMQSVFKHVLTEGDKFLVSQISHLEDQGAYALANNYGSLIARVFFQPVEEMSRVFFSKTLETSPSISEKNNSSDKPRIDSPISKRVDISALNKASQVLISILSVQVAASLILFAFAPPFLPLLLQIGLPRRYLVTSAPQLLEAWVWYIPILAANGVMEAFMSSVATPQDIRKQSRWMAAFSVVFVAVTGLFYRIGLQDISLIYANIINLLLRIVFACRFATQHYQRCGQRDLLRWAKALPKWPFVGLVTLSGYLVRTTALLTIDNLKHGQIPVITLWKEAAQHIAQGILLALGCSAIWWAQTGRHVALLARRHA